MTAQTIQKKGASNGDAALRMVSPSHWAVVTSCVVLRGSVYRVRNIRHHNLINYLKKK